MTMDLATKTLRVLAVLFIAGGATLIAPPAQAAPTITFIDCPEEPPEPTPPDPEATPAPPPECTPREGDAIDGVRRLRFEVDAGSLNRIRRVEVYILSQEEDEGIPSPDNPVHFWDYPDLAQAPPSQTFTYDWNTPVLTPYNGAYAIRVRATSQPDGQSAVRDRINILVDNAPATPAAPRVLVATTRGVSLEWDAAAEPDVLGYRVYAAKTSSQEEEPGSGDFEAVDVVAEPSYLHETSSDGAYWYRVQVLRRSVVDHEEECGDPGVICSELSATSESAGVVVTPTPSPEPASGSGGGGGASLTPRQRPRLSPRALPRLESRAPAVPDAPYSAILPYDLPDGSDEAAFADPDFVDDQSEDGAGVLPGIAIGAFLVSAALALGRMPT